MQPEHMKFDTQEQRTVHFGKHKGQTYEEMAINNPSYCEWVITTYEIEDEASYELKHFAAFLLFQGFGGRPVPTRVPEVSLAEQDFDADWEETPCRR